MHTPNPTDLESVAFLGLRLRALDQVIGTQGRSLLNQCDIRTPHACVSVLRCVALNQPTTVTVITTGLGLSRQVVLQRLKNLEDLDFISSEESTEDRRSRLINLTPEGEQEDRRLCSLLVDIGEAFQELEKELGVNLSKVLFHARNLLERRSLPERIFEMKKQASQTLAASAS